ncbi:MAG: tetratricopeptide repeat protein [Crocinitomicaceae bacterium]
MHSHIRQLITLLIFCFLSSSYFAQDDLIELKKSINDKKISSVEKHYLLDSLVEIYSVSQIDSAVVYGEKLIQNAVLCSDDKFSSRAYSVNTYIAYLSGNHAKALDLANLSVKLARKRKDFELLASCYNLLAAIHKRMGNFPKALEYNLKSLKIAEEEIDDKTHLAGYLNNTAVFYEDIGEFVKCKEYLVRSLKLAEGELNNKLILALAQGSLGKYLLRMGDFDLGSSYLEMSLLYFEETKDLGNVSEILNILGKEYTRRRQFATAGEYLLEALTLAKKLNDKSLTAKAYLSLAANAIEEKEEGQVQFYLNQAWEMNQLLGQKRELKECSKLFYTYFKQKGEHSKALVYNELYFVYSDSLLNDEIQEELDYARIQFDIERANYADSLKEVGLTKEFELKQKAEEKRLGIYLAAAFIILGLLIIGFLTYLSQVSKRNNLEKKSLLGQIELLKWKKSAKENSAETSQFDQEKIQGQINFTLNETDWSILKVLYNEPSITNKDLSAKVFVGYEGVRSSLKKMYTYFNIDKSVKNKKMALIMNAIELSS